MRIEASVKPRSTGCLPVRIIVQHGLTARATSHPEHSNLCCGMRRWSLLLLLAMFFSLLGCNPNRNGREPYYGPTLALNPLVEQINRNNAQLNTLWIEHDYDAKLIDEKGKRTTIWGDGYLLYRSPQDLLFTGDLPTGRAFELGSNGWRYWMRVPASQVSTMWWGEYQHLGKPCVQEMPIRPDLILAVLAVSTIPTDFTKLPAPVLRFNHDRDAYMITWVTRGPSRLIASKEVWYDRKTLNPINVLLFDDDGRVLLRAYLTKHAPFEIDQVSKAQWPVVAREYNLFFPPSGSSMKIDVRRVMKQMRKGRAVSPNDAAFEFPDPPGVSKVIQLDENCEQ